MRRFTQPCLGLTSVALIAASLATSGCVTGRRSFDIAVPKGQVSSANKGTFAITAVTDNRVFADKDSSPSTPSVHGKVAEFSAEQLSHFIGRQRNTYGHAMGDITFPGNETVQDKIKELLTEGLRRHGYTLGEAGSADHQMSVNIDKFWAWTNPGFLALSFEANVACKLTVTKAAGAPPVVLEIKGYNESHGQFAKNKNWQQSYDAAFDQFLKDLDQQLTNNGL